MSELSYAAQQLYPDNYSGATINEDGTESIGFKYEAPDKVREWLAVYPTPVTVLENLGFSEQDQLDATDDVWDQLAELVGDAPMIVGPVPLEATINVQVSPDIAVESDLQAVIDDLASEGVDVPDDIEQIEIVDAVGSTPVVDSTLTDEETEIEPGVQVEIDSALSDDTNATLAAQAAAMTLADSDVADAFQINILTTDVAQAHTTADLNGGNQLSGAAGVCTNGFNFTYNGVAGTLTAGHCAMFKYVPTVTKITRQTGAFGLVLQP